MSEPAYEPGKFHITAKISNLANSFVDMFQGLDPTSADPVEPAILSPFWAPGDMVNISGPSGSGKTHLAADLVISAVVPDRHGKALGGLFQFDEELFGGGKIAIIDGENGISRWKSLIKRKLLREGYEDSWDSGRVLYIPIHELNLHAPQYWTERSEALAEALNVARVRFYIGDTVARIWSPEDVTSTGWVQRGMAPFRIACRDYGIAGLMLTHVRRPIGTQKVSAVGPIGSSFQEGQADGQIMVYQTKEGNRQGIQLVHKKSRRSFWITQNSSVKLLFTNQLGYEPIGNYHTTWAHKPPEYSSELDEHSITTVSRTLALLHENHPNVLSTHDVAMHLQISERTARYHLHTLEDQGLVNKVSGGRNTRWRLKGDKHEGG